MGTANTLRIGHRRLGAGQPCYMIAEMSANHGHDYGKAVALVHAAKEAGADAIKLQTYTADTITLASDKPHFRVQGGTIWDGTTLHALYQTAYTPWDWQPRLKEEAEKLGLACFSTPFDATAVAFLEQMGVPAYKIASFELNDLPLIRLCAATGKPLIMSTGMASLGEVDEAVRAAREAGAKEIALLRCSSAYPSPASAIHLRTIPHLAETFGVVAGLSDHPLGIAVAVASVALGAKIIEKHFTLARADGGPDASFSLEPAEFKAMVEQVRVAEQALGTVSYGPSEHEKPSMQYRRSLFVVQDVKRGDLFTSENVRSIRPGNGLAPKHLPEVLGKRAARDVERGEPLAWELVR